MNYYLVVKSKKARLRFFSVEPLKLRVKYLLDSSLPVQLKNLLYIKHMKNRKLSFSIAYVHSRCLINFRARSVFKRFRMSRITMKQFASCGELTGVAKSSW